MKVRINTYDNLSCTIEFAGNDWKEFIAGVMSAGWIGCDGFWCGLKNLASLQRLPEPENNVVPMKPDLALVDAGLTEGDIIP